MIAITGMTIFHIRGSPVPSADFARDVVVEGVVTLQATKYPERYRDDI